MGNSTRNMSLCFQAILFIVLQAAWTSHGYVDTDPKDTRTNFIAALLDKYGSNGFVSKEQFQTFSDALGLNADVTLKIPSCNSTVNCLPNCLGYNEIFTVFAENNTLSTESFHDALPSLVYSMQSDNCHHYLGRHNKVKATSAEVWGYSFAFGSLVVLISNIGILMAPCMKTRMFQKILMFLVALAVGALCATGIMVLIPEALEITGDNGPVHGYRLKLATVVIGIYVFFVVERLMQIRTMRSEEREKRDKEIHVDEFGMLKERNGDISSHEHSHASSGGKTVAWTLMLGDAFHNFSDGLAIGAAFTTSMFTGISVSLAVITEELPHELGDIAILLHTGFSIKKALFVNFLAAVIIYIGIVLGVLIGTNTSANTYIFALAGGLFVYIALADMIPEMNIQAKNALREKESHLSIFVIQILGLLVGFGIVLILVYFGSQIEVS